MGEEIPGAGHERHEVLVGEQVKEGKQRGP